MSLINIYVMVVFVVLPLICVDLNKEKFTVFFFFHYNTKNIYCILLRFWIERMRIKKKTSTLSECITKNKKNNAINTNNNKKYAKYLNAPENRPFFM